MKLEKIINFEPLSIILRWTVYFTIFNKLKLGIKEVGNDKKVIENIQETLNDVSVNLLKQTISFYTSFYVLYYQALPGIKELFNNPLYDPNMSVAIISPILSGFIVAWYVITFGSIKKAFLNLGFIVTYFMFTTFIVSVGILVMIAYHYLPIQLANAILFVAGSAVVGSIIYDMLDLLRVGIDSEGLEFYVRANEKMRIGKRLF